MRTLARRVSRFSETRGYVVLGLVRRPRQTLERRHTHTCTSTQQHLQVVSRTPSSKSRHWAARAQPLLCAAKRQSATWKIFACGGQRTTKARTQITRGAIERNPDRLTHNLARHRARRARRHGVAQLPIAAAKKHCGWCLAPPTQQQRDELASAESRRKLLS